MAGARAASARRGLWTTPSTDTSNLIKVIVVALWGKFGQSRTVAYDMGGRVGMDETHYVAREEKHIAPRTVQNPRETLSKPSPDAS